MAISASVDEVPEIIGGVKVGKRRQRPFLKGPIDWCWLCKAGAVSQRSSAMAVALCVRYLAGRTRHRTVVLGHKVIDEIGISRRAAVRGLRALEAAGLVTVQRGPGKAPRVTVQEVP